MSVHFPDLNGHGPSLSERNGEQLVTRNIAIATLVAALASGTASADTLREALVSTYQANPNLTAQREALKATDATVASCLTARSRKFRQRSSSSWRPMAYSPVRSSIAV